MKRLLIGLLVAGGLIGQQTAPSSIALQEPALPTVSNINANYSGGTAGNTSYYYWLIARFAAGNSGLSVPTVVNFLTPTVGSIVVNWQTPTTQFPVVTTITYDVLRTTSQQFPVSGTCTNCLVAGATSANTATDNLGTLAGYTLNTYVPQIYQMTIDNTGEPGFGLPRLRMVTNNQQVAINLAQAPMSPSQASQAYILNNVQTSGVTEFLFRFNNVTNGVISLASAGNAIKPHFFRFGTVNDTLGEVELDTGNNLPALICDQNQVCTFTNPCINCGAGGSSSSSWTKFSISPGNSNFSVATISSVLKASTNLNDIEMCAGYSASVAHTYLIQTDSSDTPDTFEWSIDGGAFTTGVAITGSCQTLSNGFAVVFAATTGHAVGCDWTFAVALPVAQAGFLSQELTLVTPPAKNTVAGVVMSQPTTFSGTSITNLTASVGRTGNETDFSTSVCLIAGTCISAIGATTPLYYDGGTQIYSTASQSIVVYLASVGANLNALTTGVLNIWLSTSVLP